MAHIVDKARVVDRNEQIEVELIFSDGDKTSYVVSDTDASGVIKQISVQYVNDMLRELRCFGMSPELDNGTLGSALCGRVFGDCSEQHVIRTIKSEAAMQTMD